jgi:hypothetical protein
MNIPSPLRRRLGRGKPFNFQYFKYFKYKINQTFHTKNNMTIKKVSSIAKLEDLGRIQNPLIPRLLPKEKELSLRIKYLHILHNGVPSPF